MHAHFGTCHHQRIAGIITRIPHIAKVNALEISEMLPNGQQICEHLGRMELIGQAVPYRDFGVFCQCFHDFLTKSAILDAIVHGSQHSCCICYTFFLADL